MEDIPAGASAVTGRGAFTTRPCHSRTLWTKAGTVPLGVAKTATPGRTPTSPTRSTAAGTHPQAVVGRRFHRTLLEELTVYRAVSFGINRGDISLDEVDGHVSRDRAAARIVRLHEGVPAGKVWTGAGTAIQDCLVKPTIGRLRAPTESLQAEDLATIEAAQRTLEASLAALRELQAAQHRAERLVRQALESVSRMTPSSAAPKVAVQESPFLSVVELAEVLGVSRRLAMQMVKDRAIPSFRLGQRIVVPRASLEGWEEEIEGQGLG